MALTQPVVVRLSCRGGLLQAVWTGEGEQLTTAWAASPLRSFALWTWKLISLFGMTFSVSMGRRSSVLCEQVTFEFFRASEYGNESMAPAFRPYTPPTAAPPCRGPTYGSRRSAFRTGLAVQLLRSLGWTRGASSDEQGQLGEHSPDNPLLTTMLNHWLRPG